MIFGIIIIESRAERCWTSMSASFSQYLLESDFV